ncbi:MAG: response regulator [Kiritimatiellae bacterium]|nr:response regulator [Kiritimatiellia bacterium]
MAKKPARVYKRSDRQSGSLGSTVASTLSNPTRVYKEGASKDQLSITQQVVQHPAQQRIRSEEAVSKYDEFLHCVFDAVIMTDTEGLIFEVNARAEHDFMWTREQFTELNIVDVISGADIELLKVVRKNVSNQKFTILEAVCVRNDESCFHAEIVVNKLKGQKRKSLCFFVRDITVRKQVEEELTLASEQLVQFAGFKERLESVSVLCRKLNNPLQILSCMAEVEQNNDLKEQVTRIVKVLQELINSESFDGVAGENILENVGTVPTMPCECDRVMVVEDEGMLRNMFVSALASAFPDIMIESAPDGRRAAELFEQSFHGVLVMDVSMPVMSGEDAFSSIVDICGRHNRCMPPIVFCTGFDVSDKLAEIIGDGSYHTCLRKPLAIADLVDTVRRKLATVYPASPPEAG